MTTSDDHTWTVRSRHRTSTGIVSYQTCHCGLWRVTGGTGSALAHRVGADRPGAVRQPSHPTALRAQK